MSITLYAWANPLSAWKGADHTWVTTFPAPSSCPPPTFYWYCWGVCHPTGAGTTARLLGTRTGDLAYASCICTPNNPADHGGINLYGIDGVCHQLANRVLYATNPPQLDVSGAKQYWLSQWLFGTYGLTHKDWAARKSRCAKAASLLAQELAKRAMNLTDQAAFDDRIRKQLGPRLTEDLLGRMHTLQRSLLDEKALLDTQVVGGTITGEEFANRVNQLVGRYLVNVGELIGTENCSAIFDAAPGEEVEVIVPGIAREFKYTP